ncbi:MAG: hypothetical protein M3N08_02320 [Pseudomonadota bacterium]|nr:hypothetical protein [Pseudomonadota bacterium]
MRKSLTILGCMALIAAPGFVGSAAAYNNVDNSATTTYQTRTYQSSTYQNQNGYQNNNGYANANGYQNARNNGTGYEHSMYQRTPDTGAMQMEPYEKNGEFIVNPVEMTNTRDNRGTIPGNINAAFMPNGDYYRANNAAWNGQRPAAGYTPANGAYRSTTTTNSTYQQ